MDRRLIGLADWRLAEAESFSAALQQGVSHLRTPVDIVLLDEASDTKNFVVGDGRKSLWRG